MKTHLLIIIASFSTTISFSQATLIKDIEPGITSSAPNGLVVFNGNLYFAATTSNEGMELWKSDGTSSGTVLVNDIQPGSSGSAPESLTVFGNKLYFLSDNGSIGRELGVTDGSTNGVTFLDVYQGASGSNISYITSGANLLYLGGHLFDSGIDFGEEVFSIDPSFSLFYFNSLTRITMDGSFGNPENLFYDTPSGQLFFSANNGSDGKEIYVWNGVSFSEQQISNINPTGHSSPNYFIGYNNKVYFSATNGTNGVELFEVDPGNSNTVTLIKDINPSSDGNPTEKIVFNNKIYFAANDGTNGNELWESDGTNGGTQMVFNLNAGAASSNPSNFHIYNNRLYFTATNAGLGTELFYVTTGGNIINASNINPGSASSNPDNLIEYNGKLYFTADDGTNGFELWETTGTALSTVMSADINTAGSSNPSNLVVLNDEIFFAAFGNSSASGRELWKYKDPLLSNEELGKEIRMSLFPNPAFSVFSIECNCIIDKVEIINMNGQSVKTFNGDFNEYSITELSNGLYFAKIFSHGNITTRKIIKH